MGCNLWCWQQQIMEPSFQFETYYKKKNISSNLVFIRTGNVGYSYFLPLTPVDLRLLCLSEWLCVHTSSHSCCMFSVQCVCTLVRQPSVHKNAYLCHTFSVQCVCILVRQPCVHPNAHLCCIFSVQCVCILVRQPCVHTNGTLVSYLLSPVCTCISETGMCAHKCTLVS